MGCSGSAETDLDKIDQWYGTAWTYWNSAYVYVQRALDHWDLSQDHDAIRDLISAIGTGCLAAFYHVGGYTPFGPTEYAVPHYLRYHVGGDVDMDALLTTMLTADYEQLQKFIGIVDAYRIAIWNQPFNETFYYALAEGFRP